MLPVEIKTAKTAEYLLKMASRYTSLYYVNTRLLCKEIIDDNVTSCRKKRSEI